jgi:DNA-binding beta-propeller fold protein YncE
VELQPEEDNTILTWKCPETTWGVSLNNLNDVNNLLFTCRSGIHEYSTDGYLIRVTHVPDDTVYAWHTVQLADDRLVICHGGGDSKHRVCLLTITDEKPAIDNQTGKKYTECTAKITANFGNTCGSSANQLNEPRNIAVDRRNGFIYVADAWNHRIVVLSATFAFRHCLKLTNDSLHRPRCLCLDENSERLYVGEDCGRVVIIKV